MSSSNPPFNTRPLDITVPSTPAAGPGSTLVGATPITASRPQAPSPASMGTKTTATDTDGISIARRPSQLGDADASRKSSTGKHMYHAPPSVGGHRTAGTAPSNTHTGEVEIIDLCSDSDDEHLAAPPTKKAKRDIDIRRQALDVRDGTGRLRTETETEKGNGVFQGVTWRGGREDIKEESPEHQATTLQTVGPSGGNAVPEKDMATLLPTNPRRKAEDKDYAHDTSNAPTTPVPETDEIIIEVRNPNIFTMAQVGRLDDVKPVPRIETIRTEIGTKKRKIVGPFVLEDCDDDDKDKDITVCSPDDEGYGSFRDGPRKFNRSIESTILGPDSERSSAQPMSLVGRNTRLGEVELYERRRQSEDKCAEVSRRMREDAIAERKAGLQQGRPVGLSTGFLEDASTLERDAALSRPQTTLANPASESLGSVPACQSKQSSFTDEDDLLGPDGIEAQLDLAQAYFNGNGNLPSWKDLSRSCHPSISSSEMEKADRDDEPGSLSNGRDRPLRDFIPRPDKPLSDGARGKTITSGSDNSKREQAEKYYWRKVKKEARRKEKWPEKVELERNCTTVAPSPGGHCAAGKVTDGARGRDEARLLAAKEPLKAAPNSNGVLAQLARDAEGKEGKAAKVDDARDSSREQGPQEAHRPSSPDDSRRVDDHPLDGGVWTKEGSLRERKRDIENLMSAFTETAKCWCVAFDTMSPRFQELVESEVQQLRGYAGPILRGYTFREKAEKRITKIKSNMVRRTSKYEQDGRSGCNPSQYELDLALVGVMGEDRFQRGKELLSEVLMEYEAYKARPEARSHHKRLSSKPSSNGSGRPKPKMLSTMPYEEEEKTQSGSKEASQYAGLNLSRKQQVAWQREEARRQRIMQAMARFDEGTEPPDRAELTKKVHFSHEGLWDNRLDRMQYSESEESDEDEDETAPSFGRGGNDSNSHASRVESKAGNAEPARTSPSGKGVLSQLRKPSEEATEPSQASAQCSVAGKRLPTQNGNVPPVKRQNTKRSFRSGVGGKSLPITRQQQPQGQSTIQSRSPDIEESQDDTDELEFETEGCFPDEDGADDVHEDMYVPQYDIVADYEDIDEYHNADSVPLGRHTDIKAALRQMNKVITDIAASVSRKYRQVRIIWDTDDFELAAQTIILPTGGECRVRMVKSWAPATNWPGKRRASAVVAPKVFYIVHETKKTSFRPSLGTGGDTEEDERFGPEDFEDLQEVVEKERDMCFSSKQCANQIAKNRLMAFMSRHGMAEDAEGTAKATELAKYMEQIEHDKACFEQETRHSIETKEAKKGNEEIKIWVEEIIADMPHI